MPPVGRKDGLIDLKMVCSLNVLVIIMISVAFIVVVV